MVSRSARVNDEGPRNSASARPFSGPAVSGNCASNPTMPGNCGSSICGTPPSCPIGHRAAVPGPPAAADRSGAEGMKAGTYFLDEEGRLFEGGEVAAPRGFGPVADVGKRRCAQRRDGRGFSFGKMEQPVGRATVSVV